MEEQELEEKQTDARLSQAEHPDERGVAVLWGQVIAITWNGIIRQSLFTEIDGGRTGVGGIEDAGDDVACGRDALSFDVAYFYRFGWASLHARRSLSFGETRMAHVAFTDDSETGIEFRNVVGAGEDAVLASNTLIIEVADNAGDGVFFVSQNRATTGASGVVAMVTGARDGLAPGIFLRSADEQF